MGKEAAVIGYDAVIKLCVQDAKTSNDVEETALDHIDKAIEYLNEMNQLGFTIGTRTYGPLLNFLVDMGMVEELQICKDVISETNPDALVKLVTMKIVKDEEKIRRLCSQIADNGKSLSVLQGTKRYVLLY